MGGDHLPARILILVTSVTAATKQAITLMIAAILESEAGPDPAGVGQTADLDHGIGLGVVATDLAAVEGLTLAMESGLVRGPEVSTTAVRLGMGIKRNTQLKQIELIEF